MQVSVQIETHHGSKEVVFDDAITYSFKEEYLIIRGVQYTKYIKKCLVISLLAKESNIKKIRSDANGI